MAHVSYAADGSPVIVVPQHSVNYLRWCNSGKERQRAEVYARQDGNCWLCGKWLGRKYDLHHMFYDNLGYEETSDLVAVHWGRCHRALEAAKAAEMTENLDAHWTAAT